VAVSIICIDWRRTDLPYGLLGLIGSARAFLYS
jgi:hypothetical protein